MSTVDEEKLKQLKKELEKFKKGETIKGRSRTTPLGKLFDQISNKIDGFQLQKDVVGFLYNNFGGDKTETDRIYKRRYVIGQILNSLSEINKLSMKNKESSMISIPLYDIRIVGELTNILIIHGIYSVVPQGYLIPLDQRKLKNFKIQTAFERIDFKAGAPILKDILCKMTQIFESDSDLKDLILVGTGFTDTLSVAVLFSFSSDEYRQYLDKLESKSSTYQLLSFYSLLYRNSKQNPKYANFVLSLLTKQILKPNGMESLIDLVMGLREDEDIDITKINYVVQVIISSKPTDMSAVEYFQNIFTQIYKLLILVNRPLMNTILVEIINDIYLKNKAVIIDFLFKEIWKTFNPEPKKESDDIVLVCGVDLNNAFNVCLSISRSLNRNNQEIINELFEPVLLKLWYYANFQKEKGKDYGIVVNLIKNIIILGDTKHFVKLIISNLINFQDKWVFGTEDNNLTYIKCNTNEVYTNKDNKFLKLFDEIDFYVDSFVELATKLNDSDSELLNTVLITVLDTFTSKSFASNLDLPIQRVIDLKLIQSLLETFRIEIEDTPIAVLFFTNTYLTQFFNSKKSEPDAELRVIDEENDSDDEDGEEAIIQDSENVIALVPVLEIISELRPSRDDEKNQLERLQTLLKQNNASIPTTIKPFTDRIVEIDTHNLVLKPKIDAFNIETILKQINDTSPSIRVYALNNLTEHALSGKTGDGNSNVSVKYTVSLLIAQLKDPEPYVYLNSIKCLVSIISYDKSFLGVLVDQYSHSPKSIDEKLRLGEVITKFVKLNGKVLKQDQVKEIITMCINIARSDSKLQQRYKDNKDVRMKMSALSILGISCSECGYDIVPYVSDIVDLIHGIITFEESVELKRAAVVIVNDIVRNEKGLEILENYGEKIQILLEFIAEKDTDLLVSGFAEDALNSIEESFQKKLKISG